MSTRAYDDIATSVAAVDGWMTPEQGRRLFAAAARCRPGGRIVEIGSFRGKSTIVLATAAPDGVEVVAIDPHAGNDRGPQELIGFEAEAADDHAMFNANLAAAGVAGRVHHIRAFSAAAHDEVGDPIDVLYIDGAHRFAPARRDIAEWGSRVADGGTLLIHDAFSSIGVTLAILRVLSVGSRFRYVGRSRTLAEYRADLSGGIRGRGVNLLRQLAQLPWFTKNVALKVALSLGLGKVLARVGRRPPEWPY
ncbi:MAG TPA: class I SAM-dependent methyltransferase [Ilumatobacteraceae bacterium]|nr:class I SAM-dependent methyltransferase [Ilumatobacteraceae bacterium]